MLRPFTKPATTIEQQIDHLRAEGMIVSDIARTEHWLRHVSYYRLSAYWFLLSIPNAMLDLASYRAPASTLSRRCMTLIAAYDCSWRDELTALLAEHPTGDMDAMGFPSDWDVRPLWK